MSLVDLQNPTVLSASRVAPWRGLLPSAVVGLGIYLFLICAGSQLLNDPDSQWHVAVGRWIWTNGGVPTTDVFSHTFRGAPWIAKEWGSQLALFAAYQVAGWSGVVALSAACIALAFGMLHERLLRRMRSTVALALTLIAALLCAPHLLARPHALVLPVMVFWVGQLVAARERETAPPLGLALVMALWVNLHGSFPLGLMLAGLLAGEGVLLGKTGALLGRLRDWGFFLGAATASTLLSPYGWNALLVPLRMADNEALPFIAEWQPLGFDLAGIVAIALLLVALWALAADPRKNAFRMAAIGLLAVMMVQHSRFIDQFALCAPLLFASALGARRGLEPVPAHGPSALIGGLTAALVLAASIVSWQARPMPDPKMAPEAALRAALAQHVDGPVYNAYDFGGFLIAHDVPTFVDGRTDQLFLGGFLTRLEAARNAKDDSAFVGLLARHGVGWALVRPGSPEARHLARMPRWSQLYSGQFALVFAKGR